MVFDIKMASDRPLTFVSKPGNASTISRPLIRPSVPRPPTSHSTRTSDRFSTAHSSTRASGKADDDVEYVVAVTEFKGELDASFSTEVDRQEGSGIEVGIAAVDLTRSKVSTGHRSNC